MQSGELLDVLVQTFELAQQHGMGFQQSPRNQLKSGVTGDQFVDPSCKRPLGGLADLQTKAPQYTAQAVLEVAQLRLQQLACRQNSARFLGFDRLAVHRPEPAQPHQLRDPAGVIAVRLHRHRFECVANMPRLQKLNRKTRLAQRCIEPLRQRSSLQADPLDLRAQQPEPGDQRLRLTRNLCLPNNIPRAVDNAHCGAFQRHVNSCIMVHGRPSMMLGAGLPNSGY